MTAENWVPSTIGADAELLTGFPFKSGRYVDDTAGVKLLRGDNVVQGALRWEGAKRWPRDQLLGIEQYILRDGDIVLAMDRPWIEAGLKYAAVSAHDTPCLLVQRVARLRGGPNLDVGFVRYLIGCRTFTEHVLAIQTGTAVPHISGSQIKAFKYLRPPLPEQRAIAHILGALDDKIDLNRRRNRTLEAMARAIFQSWFVAFDPVKAKAAGELPPGLSPEVAALFPDAFEESALGPIPAGWRMTTLGEQITAAKGLSYKGQHLCEAGEGLPMHNLNSVFEGGGYKHAGLKWYNGEYRPTHLLTPGDVIVTNTEQGFEHLLIGYAAIVPHGYGPRGLFSHHVFRVQARPTSHLPAWFTYLLLRTPQFHDVVAGHSNGTTINMLPADGLQKPAFALPPKSIVDVFGALFEPLHHRLEAALGESGTLAALRDALLPKLVSGELRVADAVRIVGRAT